VLLSSRCRTAAALQRLHARLNGLEPASLRLVMLVEGAAAVVLGLAVGAVAGLLAAAVGLGLLAGHSFSLRRLARPDRARVVGEPGHTRVASPT